MIRSVLGIAIAMSAACSYEGSFGDCEIACTPSTGCPAGFTCSASEGLCRGGAMATSCAAIFDGGLDGDIAADLDNALDGGVDGGSACPAMFGGGRYLFVNTLMEWPAAEAYCTSLDSTLGDATYVHLVIVGDAGELGQLTPTGTPMDDAWLGYTDARNPSASSDPVTIASNFRWVTDEQSAPGFAMWASGQPQETTPPRCAYKNFSDGLMHDRTCTGHTRTFFCECDAFPENL